MFRQPYDKIVSFLENTDLFEIFWAPVSEQFLFSLGETPVFVAGSLSLCFGGRFRPRVIGLRLYVLYIDLRLLRIMKRNMFHFVFRFLVLREHFDA